MTNIRIVRHIRLAQGVILSTEELGSWIVNPAEYPHSSKMDYIRQTLAECQREEPNAGWELETRGTDLGWHK